ncbi:MAG: S8 family serine peptidase [Actinobacteria bacterium]|nr:S8 family serine peptidase [Actinomycetota bacterium]
MSRSATRIIGLLCLAGTLVLGAALPAATSPDGPLDKVARLVLDQTSDGRTSSFLVVLGSKADVSAAQALPGKIAKGRFVVDTLRAHADRTQAPIVALLERMGARYRPHFLVNLLQVTGDRAVVDALAARVDVARIEANPWIRSTVLPKEGASPAGDSESPATVEWNVERVGAPKAWRSGFLGQGISLGNIDTGQQWNHPALKTQYRGWNGSSANHNYNWYDATDPNNRVPLDPFSHGTHTAGTMVGDDGGANQIGVAPEAKWMGCRSMDASGFGTPETYITCFEFMIAPWNLNGQNPDPSKAPVAVSNSWYCSISLEGCTQDVLFEVVQNVRAAGIVPVVAAGNSGPSCATIGNDGPPAQYNESYTVGATTMSNTLASFSSRGPATFDGDTLIKPDIVAPGEGVRSSVPTNAYAIFSGTSMATPHIAGAIALIHSAKPNLIGNVNKTEQLINRTATHFNSSACSSNGTFPNNLFGYGLLNAAKAVR